MRNQSVIVHAATVLAVTLGAAPTPAQSPPLVSAAVYDAIAEEASGETALRHLEVITQRHRMRGSREFHAAATHVAESLRAAGLSGVEILRFPADGVTMFGTQKARPAWDADSAELWELGDSSGGWRPRRRLASFKAMPVSLAQDSESAHVDADLIDVGAGVSRDDYAGRDVRGAIVLASSQPGPVARLAVAEFGAVGIVSYAQNQHTAWWGDDDTLVRWGHLDSFAPFDTFAFMVSPKRAHELQARLAQGERIRLRAAVEAGRHPGSLEVVTAVIPGADPERASQEIAFSCHLDHQRPGANDNASGSVAILEVARTLNTLITSGSIPRPARPIRFIFPPEIEGTLALLNGRPALAERIAAVIHMDMVGGGEATKAVFHITRGPMSLPTFINDIAEAIGASVNDETMRYASGEDVEHPLLAPSGGKEPLRAELARFSMGSDHQVYVESSFAIPSIYFNDWPDRYIHTNKDSAGNIDPTKLKRAVVLGAVIGHTLARLDDSDAPDVVRVIRDRSLARAGGFLGRRQGLNPRDRRASTRLFLEHERAVFASTARFFPMPADSQRHVQQYLDALERILQTQTTSAPASERSGRDRIVYSRTSEPRGPMSVFGYNYLTDHLGAERAAKLRLLRFDGSWGSGSEYAFEALNFVNGARSVGEIRDWLTLEYGPVPDDIVFEYLGALESIGILQRADE